MFSKTGVFRVTLSMIVLVVITAAIPSSVADRNEMTVGEFIVKLASAGGYQAPDPDTAVISLRSAGYELPTLDNSQILTEGTVVAIANSFGVEVGTANPGAIFTPAQTDALMNTLKTEIGFGAGGGGDTTRGEGNNAADPLSKGKGLKKGLYKKSPSEPS